MDDGPKKRPGETVFAVILVIFSGLALWEAYAISGLRGLSEPGVFPMLAAGTMLISGLFIFRESLSKPRSDSQSDRKTFIADILPPRLMIMIALVGFYVALMPWLGFMLASGLFLFISFTYLWKRKVLLASALTAFALSCIYVIFRLVFQVVLPKGKLLSSIWPGGLF